MCVSTPISKELRRLQRTNMKYVASVVQKAIDRREIRKVHAPALAATLFDMSRGLVERRLLGWKEFQAPGGDRVCHGSAMAGPRNRNTHTEGTMNETDRPGGYRPASCFWGSCFGGRMGADAPPESLPPGVRAAQLPLSGRPMQGASDGSVPAAQAPGPPLALSLDDAVQRGLKSNLGAVGFQQMLRSRGGTAHGGSQLSAAADQRRAQRRRSADGPGGAGFFQHPHQLAGVRFSHRHRSLSLFRFARGCFAIHSGCRPGSTIIAPRSRTPRLCSSPRRMCAI